MQCIYVVSLIKCLIDVYILDAMIKIMKASIVGEKNMHVVFLLVVYFTNTSFQFFSQSLICSIYSKYVQRGEL